MNDQCKIGELTNTTCHLETYTKSKLLIKLDELSESDFMLLKYRIENDNIIRENCICQHHKLSYFNYFSSKHLSCCNPFLIHSKPIKSNSRETKLTMSQSFNTIS